MADMINKHQIKLALGGMRFDDILHVEWELQPSIGIVARDIDLMGLALASFEEPLKRSIIMVMIPSIRKNFEKDGRPDKWQPLASYTLERKGALGISDAKKPLHRSGALKRGVTQFSIWSITDTAATIRRLPEDIWYGALHQAGYGGFASYVEAAKKSLGPKAHPADVTREAFRLMDQSNEGGRKAAKVRIPQRQFVLFQEDDIDDIQLIFYEWMVEQTILVGRFSR